LTLGCLLRTAAATTTAAAAAARNVARVATPLVGKVGNPRETLQTECTALLDKDALRRLWHLALAFESMRLGVTVSGRERQLDPPAFFAGAEGADVVGGDGGRLELVCSERMGLGDEGELWGAFV
jgi:hypothetical protein